MRSWKSGIVGCLNNEKFGKFIMAYRFALISMKNFSRDIELLLSKLI